MRGQSSGADGGLGPCRFDRMRWQLHRDGNSLSCLKNRARHRRPGSRGDGAPRPSGERCDCLERARMDGNGLSRRFHPAGMNFSVAHRRGPVPCRLAFRSCKGVPQGVSPMARGSERPPSSACLPQATALENQQGQGSAPARCRRDQRMKFVKIFGSSAGAVTP